mmetsp:Transcript_28252/g.63079  ORF Transcript_28252/g.63079 Transcript_28252/m.63079 type:complete len:268 (+) Transcript_28252:284-1087(+)
MELESRLESARCPETHDSQDLAMLGIVRIDGDGPVDGDFKEIGVLGFEVGAREEVGPNRLLRLHPSVRPKVLVLGDDLARHPQVPRGREGDLPHRLRGEEQVVATRAAARGGPPVGEELDPLRVPRRALPKHQAAPVRVPPRVILDSGHGAVDPKRRVDATLKVEGAVLHHRPARCRLDPSRAVGRRGFPHVDKLRDAELLESRHRHVLNELGLWKTLVSWKLVTPESNRRLPVSLEPLWILLLIGPKVEGGSCELLGVSLCQLGGQ